MKFDVMTGLNIGTMLIIGSGLFWVMTGTISDDCPKAKNVEMCNSVHNLSGYLQIGILLGFLVVGLTVILIPGDKQTKSDPNKDNTSRSPIT